MTKLVFGGGYLGSRVARRWLESGSEVVVVSRSDRQIERLRRDGFHAVVADVTDADSLRGLPEAETVLYAVGYDRSAAASREAVVVEGLRCVLDTLWPRTGRLVFTSSTGVMGNHGGRWVDETTTCRPEREAGLCGLRAERLLVEHPLGSRAVILRLAGLYGPGRLPKLADIEAGRPVAAPEGAYLNLIHVEDAVQAVLAAESSSAAVGLYLVSDGHPTEHREFYREMARRLGLAAPQFTQPEPGSRGALAALGSKRVRNRRMLEGLAVRLAYPSYREGLVAVCAELRGADS